MVTVAQQHQYENPGNDEGELKNENKKNVDGGEKGVTITDVYDETSNVVDYPSDSMGNSSIDDRGYVTDVAAAICVRNDSSDLRKIDREDIISGTSSTQYSDVDDSLDGDDLGSWSNDLSLPGSQVLQQFDNGVALPISELPSFGDVCVKNSANVHFGNKTFYNGPVTIKQIVYADPNLNDDNKHEEEEEEDVIVNASDNKRANCDARTFQHNGYKNSHTDNENIVDSENPHRDYKVTQWCAWLLTWRCVALMCAMGSCLVAAVVVSVVLLTRDAKEPVFPEIPESTIDGVTTKLRFISRAEWGAQPPTEILGKLELPVPYVIISHTATDFCRTQSECTFRVRFAQTFHIESRNWSDIAYSFLVGGDGYVYVGRGWDSVGAHSYGYNTKSIGISLIGTFNTVAPPKRQLIATQQLIDYGIKGGKISPDYKLLGHRQISETLSPGNALFSIITKWPNWSPKV